MSDTFAASRRAFLIGSLGAVAAAAQQAQQAISPNPAPRDWTGAEPLPYPDPDIISLDNRFRRYVINSQIRRLQTGSLWSEGPAWNGAGRYLVWSDIPNNRQLRWMEEDGHISVYRNDSGYSNGNTFDFEGRQLSCEHGNRRVVRYEQTGKVTVIADKFEGKRLNSPNDIVVHPDGGIWFTDPIYGIRGNYEGFKGDKELKEAVYRVDGKTLRIEKVTEDCDEPNGICFSPDYRKLYLADTGARLGISVFDVNGTKLANGKPFAKLTVPGGGRSFADGIRCDADGNLWCGARPGVQILGPDGQAIGMIRLPETCANICFGGTKRNRLFMAASQSLYSVYVDVLGGHIA